jgi:hypothetical protein
LVEKPSSRCGLIGEPSVNLSGRRIGERLADTPDKIVPYWREDAPQPRGDAGKPRHQHGRNAELAGDLDGVQRSGATKGEQGEIARIVPLLDRHQADRVRQLIGGDGPGLPPRQRSHPGPATRQPVRGWRRQSSPSAQPPRPRSDDPG